MRAQIVAMTSENLDMDAIKRAGDILKAGGLVAFPTETVYGLGGNALDPQASMKIYAAKGRPSDNPLIVHIAEADQLAEITTEIPQGAKILAEKYWPGPLTMILPKADIVPKETTGGLDSVAVRFPSDRIAQELIKAAGGFVAAPSANTSGRPSPTMAEQKSLYHLLTSIRLPDLFAVLMGLCAIGLVLIPELVYVRDIYENGNARANTMFKLTYQAYIMFGMTMIYVIFRLLVIGKNKILKVLAFIGLFLFVWTCGYFGNSVHSWFGEVWKPSQYKGLNATTFLETDFPEDVNGIRWLKENISDAPVVLEANGDSYSEYERVSAMTGLPTIMGWYVHEWLWRGNLSDLNAKIEEIQEIYTSTDETRVKELLEEYNVSYIFVGSCERNKYGADMNNDLLKSLGEVVFQDSEYPTYIVKIN